MKTTPVIKSGFVPIYQTYLTPFKSQDYTIINHNRWKRLHHFLITTLIMISGWWCMILSKAKLIKLCLTHLWKLNYRIRDLRVKHQIQLKILEQITICLAKVKVQHIFHTYKDLKTSSVSLAVLIQTLLQRCLVIE